MRVRMRLPRKPSREQVWIVQHDESSDNTVLGVFTTQDEAAAFAEEIDEDFQNGVFYAAFPIGYRYTDGAARYRSDF